MDNEAKPILQRGITKVLEYYAATNHSTEIVSSPFHCNTIPGTSVASYVERVVRYSQCSCEALVGALMLMQAHVQFSGYPISIYNVHRMLITSVVVSAKSRDDEYYYNTYYSKIGGIQANEMKSLELSFISTLDWDCWLDKDGFDETVAMLLNINDDPSPDELGQMVDYWKMKQCQRAQERRDGVVEQMRRDVEEEGRKTREANGCGSPTVTSPSNVGCFPSVAAVSGPANEASDTPADECTATATEHNTTEHEDNFVTSDNGDSRNNSGRDSTSFSSSNLSSRNGSRAGSSTSGGSKSLQEAANAAPFFPRSMQTTNNKSANYAIGDNRVDTKPNPFRKVANTSDSTGPLASSAGSFQNNSNNNRNQGWGRSQQGGVYVPPSRRSGSSEATPTSTMSNDFTRGAGTFPTSPNSKESNNEGGNSDNRGTFPSGTWAGVAARPGSDPSTPTERDMSSPSASGTQRQSTRQRFGASSSTSSTNTPESHRYAVVGETKQRVFDNLRYPVINGNSNSGELSSRGSTASLGTEDMSNSTTPAATTTTAASTSEDTRMINGDTGSSKLLHSPAIELGSAGNEDETIGGGSQSNSSASGSSASGSREDLGGVQISPRAWRSKRKALKREKPEQFVDRR